MLTGIVRALDDAGVHLEDIGVRRPTLDEVFLGLTGHRADPSGAAGARHAELEAAS